VLIENFIVYSRLILFISDDQQASSSSARPASVCNEEAKVNRQLKKRKTSSTKQTTPKKSRSLRSSTDKEFYDKFKRCYVDRVNTVVDENDKTECFETVEDNIRLLIMVIIENKGLGQKQMYNFAVIGKTLHYLKEKLNFKNKALDKLLEEYGPQYSKDMRNFYIRLYNFSEEYPKIIYVDISEIGIGNLFNKWSPLTDFIKKDEEFDWT
jgi:hypothetical protein